MPKLKAFADDNLNMTQTLTLDFRRVENIVGKGGNAGYQRSVLFSQCFQKASYSGYKNQVLFGKGLNGKFYI